jgi:hypothetical protein
LPSGSAIYVEAIVRPGGVAKTGATSVLRKILRTNDPGSQLVKLIDSALRKEKPGLDYRTDIEPWLGNRIGLTVDNLAADNPDLALVVSLADESKAREKLPKLLDPPARPRSYHGVNYTLDASAAATGIVHGFLIVGDESLFKKLVDVKPDKSLAQDTRFHDALAKATPDRLGLVYADYAPLIALSAREDPSLRPVMEALLGGKDAPPVVQTLSATDDGIVLDSDTTGAVGSLVTYTGGATPLLRELPASSWLALGAPRLGPSLIRLLDRLRGPAHLDPYLNGLVAQTGIALEEDLLPAIGDGAIFVEGSSPRDLIGGALLEVRHPATMTQILKKARAALAQSESARVRGTSTDFAADVGGATLRVRSREDRLLLTIGATATAVPSAAKLADSAAFRTAAAGLTDGYQLSGLVRPAPIVLLAASSGSSDDPDFRAAGEYLDRLGDISFGTRKAGHDRLDRIVMRIP